MCMNMCIYICVHILYVYMHIPVDACMNMYRIGIYIYVLI